MFRYLLTSLLFLAELPGLRPGFNSGYQPPSQPPGGGAKAAGPSGMAWATLALGIASWTLLPIAGAVVGAILGWMELKNIEKGSSDAAGKTVTQVGFWLSVVNLGLTVIGSCISLVIVIFLFGSFGAAMAAAGVSGG